MTKEQVIKNFIFYRMKGSKMVVANYQLSRGRNYKWNYYNDDGYCYFIQYTKYCTGFEEWYLSATSFNIVKSYLNIHSKTFEKYLKEYCLKRVRRYENRYGSFR